MIALLLKIAELLKEELKKVVSEAVQSALQNHSKKPATEPESIMTQSEVAEYFGVHTNTIIKWRHKGFLKAYMIGDRVFFYTKDVEKSIVPLKTNDIREKSHP